MMHTLFFHKLTLSGSEEELKSLTVLFEELPAGVSVEKENEEDETWTSIDSKLVAYFVSDTENKNVKNFDEFEFKKTEFFQQITEDIPFQFPNVTFELLTVSGLPEYWRHTSNKEEEATYIDGEEAQLVYTKTLEILKSLPDDVTLGTVSETLRQKLSKDEFNLVDLSYMFQDNVYLDGTYPIFSLGNKTLKGFLISLTELQLQQVTHLINPPKSPSVLHFWTPIFITGAVIATVVILGVLFQQ